MRSSTFLTVVSAVSLANAAAFSRSDSNPGVDITNASGEEATYYFCNNNSNGDGTADPGLPCTNLETTVVVPPSGSKTVDLSADFKGRVVRSTDMPATWVEIQVKADDGNAWGDVSLQPGCDGAATVAPTDGGSSATVGFTNTDIVAKAPDTAKTTRGDGVSVIATPWSAGTILNADAVDYLEKASHKYISIFDNNCLDSLKFPANLNALVRLVHKPDQHARFGDENVTTLQYRVLRG
ncbi:hypothetical protein VMCG_05995 [Cytospora schulzeri]|uniref:Uncharacterized protein n=1 Tax=Cytospora schulzeri TaxID=448051 RepID=A0A423WGP5_9PEZI|nr:hypothetical protein VMCG_05995 [Valsa malicola]